MGACAWVRAHVYRTEIEFGWSDCVVEYERNTAGWEHSHCEHRAGSTRRVVRVVTGDGYTELETHTVHRIPQKTPTVHRIPLLATRVRTRLPFAGWLLPVQSREPLSQQ